MAPQASGARISHFVARTASRRATGERRLARRNKLDRYAFPMLKFTFGSRTGRIVRGREDCQRQPHRPHGFSADEMLGEMDAA
jgi:hypothetical protein